MIRFNRPGNVKAVIDRGMMGLTAELNRRRDRKKQGAENLEKMRI